MKMDLHRLDQYRLPRFSWDYEDLPESAHWFLMARAYLESSIHLLEEMIQERLDSSFHHAKVAAFTFGHAIELFLKGAIAQAGLTVPIHHKSDVLLAEYRRLYPGEKFEFAGKIDEAVSPTAGAPLSEYARYPQDARGKVWKGHSHIDLSTWYCEVFRFKSDFNRVEPLVKARYPNATNKQRRPRIDGN